MVFSFLVAQCPYLPLAEKTFILDILFCAIYIACVTGCLGYQLAHARQNESAADFSINILSIEFILLPTFLLAFYVSYYFVEEVIRKNFIKLWWSCRSRGLINYFVYRMLAGHLSNPLLTAATPETPLLTDTRGFVFDSSETRFVPLSEPDG